MKLCSLLLLGVACVFYRELHKPLAFSTFRAKFTKNLFVKELSFCHKLYFSNLYIFATQCRRPLIFQTMNSVKSKFEILALEGASRPSSNCEHVLFVYIVKQNKNNSRIFTKNFVDFQNFKKFNGDRILMETNIWNFDHS